MDCMRLAACFPMLVAEAVMPAAVVLFQFKVARACRVLTYVTAGVAWNSKLACKHTFACRAPMPVTDGVV